MPDRVPNANSVTLPSDSEAVCQYLTFALGRQICGLPMYSIREVTNCIKLVDYQHEEDFIRGLVEFDRNNIGIVDLNYFISGNFTNTNDQLPIVVAQSRYEPLTLGFLVDRICGVTDIKLDDVEDIQVIGGWEKTNFANGIAMVDGQQIVILDL